MSKEDNLLILQRTKERLLEKKGIDISLEEISNICESQFKILVYAFTKGLPITLPYLGKFFTFNANDLRSRIIEPNKQTQKELIQEGKLEEAKQAMVASLANYSNVIKTIKNQPELDVDTIIALPTLEHVEDYNVFNDF